MALTAQLGFPLQLIDAFRTAVLMSKHARSVSVEILCTHTPTAGHCFTESSVYV